MSRCVQGGVVIVDRGEARSVMLCWGGGDVGGGDSGQGRVTRCHVVFRKAW